jgi:hypothetical protein
MPAGYRTALITIGAFLALGGSVGLVGGITTTSTAAQHVSSFLGSTFAIVCGFVVMRSTIAGRVPNWVAKLFGLRIDED